ncbi:MAG: hypothetical protein KatS3mg127_1968 [Silanimonas sp.]|nr:MAG: hypothetical protein KatS3mg127_1968 [Silanimonas sp.]
MPPSPLQDDPQTLSLSAALASRIGTVAGVGGWALDLRSQVLYWDAETRRIHRVPAEFVPTVESAIGFYAPEARPVIQAAVEAGIRTGEGWDLELPLTRADDEPFWARAVGMAEFEDGQPVRLLGTFQDITHQRAERLATEQARQQLALAIQSGRIGVWHVDPGSGGAVWDEWVFRQYGREPRPGLVMARDWAGWLHPEDRPRVLAGLAAAVAGVPQESLEFRVLWPDGAVRHLRAAAHPVRDAEGRVLRVVGLNWDVTSERELEQVLRGGLRAPPRGRSRPLRRRRALPWRGPRGARRGPGRAAAAGWRGVRRRAVGGADS